MDPLHQIQGRQGAWWLAHSYRYTVPLRGYHPLVVPVTSGPPVDSRIHLPRR